MWQRPKTDWRAGDYFNVRDYNRIKGNINELRTMALTLWPDFALEDMGDDKTHQDHGFYADEINRFEANIGRVCAGTYPFAAGDRKTYHDNQPFIDWRELNRIESACLLIYNNIQGRADGIGRLALTLNGGAFE